MASWIRIREYRSTPAPPLVWCRRAAEEPLPRRQRRQRNGGPMPGLGQTNKWRCKFKVGAENAKLAGTFESESVSPMGRAPSNPGPSAPVSPSTAWGKHMANEHMGKRDIREDDGDTKGWSEDNEHGRGRGGRERWVTHLWKKRSDTADGAVRQMLRKDEKWDWLAAVRKDDCEPTGA